MLAADKLQLQSALKQQATALKEKEFNLHHTNFMTVGTQAAVLAGLDITMFIEFTPHEDSAWATDLVWVARSLKMVYYAIIVGAFCANMIVVSQTTALSVLGAGMALRGPDGSMMTATEGLYEERSSVFKTFGIGLSLTVGSILLSVWLLLEWEAAIVCFLISAWASRKIYSNYRRVQQRFDFDESQTVDFTDIFQGPAAIRAVPWEAVPVKINIAKETVNNVASSMGFWGRSRSMPVVQDKQDSAASRNGEREQLQHQHADEEDSCEDDDGDVEQGVAMRNNTKKHSASRRANVKNRKTKS
mmetsp:Transcript_9620/g.12705  ORF Transcript_9620/g.12705 Transcript_9620/m.12705 type:complete len:302 (-) Transcript_9620:122-1027(-)|eukprot:CAMPEP_0198145038 /NCGR_PEP_ID=MMETSP1443-20131203/20603_1 /TAXON_ID=186043 /ORGANISM="Entomoneis sp., Strain CCMP2396" /LENGTH=301 /DNA_ID=CAMNT_0043808553 /DNA_START=226 /DNA_END=1131 /DNA_ORIENTATION=+